VTQPDRPSGRGQKLQSTPVKSAATQLSVPVLSPESVREIVAQLRELGADLFVVASYGEILSQAVLNLPRIGALNVHPSLLPLYRGATPLQAQIRDLRATTGVTIIEMDAGMDTGDVVLQQEASLSSSETYGELEPRLAKLGAEVLARAVELAKTSALERTPQSKLGTQAQIDATLTRPLRSGDLRIDWSRSAMRVDALVRSLSPQPCARGEIAGIATKIISTRPLAGSSDQMPGTPYRIPHGLAVACGEGSVAIERIIPANRSAMNGEAFAASVFGRK
jgi:methionyl-tRNA formyltransferase